MFNDNIEESLNGNLQSPFRLSPYDHLQVGKIPGRGGWHHWVREKLPGDIEPRKRVGPSVACPRPFDRLNYIQ